MATIAVTSELDVISKYKDLITNSLGSDSVYIRTKETLEELFAANTLSNTEKAQVISAVMSALNTSVVQTSMTTALQWASKEKDVALHKLELAKQLDILDTEDALKQAQVDKIVIDGINAQAEALRMYGTPTIVDGKVISLSADGKVYEDILAVKQNVQNAIAQHELIGAQTDGQYANTHKAIADTYANFGNFTYTLSGTGVPTVTDMTPGTVTTLSDVQKVIAKEQAKGYVYNAWANAATGLGSAIGVALSSDAGEVIPEATISDWGTAVNQLKDLTLPTF